MKKSAIVVLIVMTVAFAAFVGGFYLGRNYNHADIQISATQVTTTAPPSGSTAVSAPAVTTAAPGLIDINTATLEQLESLPGIGAVRAQAIIDYRSEYGPFTRPEDLLNVSGIGEKTLAKLLDYITVGG